MAKKKVTEKNAPSKGKVLPVRKIKYTLKLGRLEMRRSDGATLAQLDWPRALATQQGRDRPGGRSRARWGI